MEKLDKAISGKELDDDYEHLINNFVSSFDIVHKEFKVLYTNKVHIIESHLKEYLDTTKEGLGKHSDQLVEQMHQEVNNLLYRSCYWVNNPTSEISGE